MILISTGKLPYAQRTNVLNMDPREEEMTRLEGLIRLELGNRYWTLVFESLDRKGSGVLAPNGMPIPIVIEALTNTVTMLKGELAKEQEKEKE